MSTSPGPTPPPNASGCFKWGCGLFLFFFIFLPISCSVLRPKEKLFSEQEMYAAATKAVQQSLLSPTSAIFPRWSDKEKVAFFHQKNFSLVIGEVDSQNGYGAMIHQRWVVTVRFSKSTGDYLTETPRFVK